MYKYINANIYKKGKLKADGHFRTIREISSVQKRDKRDDTLTTQKIFKMAVV